MTHVYTQMHTSADLLKSTIRLEQLIPFLQEQNTQACAIVNSKLYGLLPFCKAMQQANIHAVLGLTVNVQWQETVIPVVLYAQTQEGYQHLLKISSAVSIKENEVLPWKWLKGYSAGCLAMLPTSSSLEIDEWTKVASALHHVFIERFYVGIARPAGIVSATETAISRWCEAEHIQIVATHDSYFLRQKIILPMKLLEPLIKEQSSVKQC